MSERTITRARMEDLRRKTTLNEHERAELFAYIDVMERRLAFEYGGSLWRRKVDDTPDSDDELV